MLNILYNITGGLCALTALLIIISLFVGSLGKDKKNIHWNIVKYSTITFVLSFIINMLLIKLGGM